MKRADMLRVGGTIAAALLFVLVVCFILPSYWVFMFTGAVITGVALQGVGLVANRAGMIALCQMSFAAIGAWVVAWLNVTGVPGGLLLWTLIGGLAAVPFGIAIGLPALRLRGINLAIVTVGFAAAFDVILLSYTFPGQTKFIFVKRPDLLASDRAYFVFCVAVFAIIGLALDATVRRPIGASWFALRNSERGTAALGISVPQSKLTAFALSAFIAGISGGLLAGQLGTLVANSFSLMVSMVYYVVATMAGAHFMEGALLGGILIIFFPELLRRLNLPQDIGNIFFAIGAVQALSMGGTMAEDLRRFLRKVLGFGNASAAPAITARPEGIAPPPVSSTAIPVLSIEGLTVKYGAVVALQDVSFNVPEGAVIGLIGPNGAGKSTLIDAVTGFLSHYEGQVKLAGQSMNQLQAHERSRTGFRRTWQTTRIPPQLAVGVYLDLSAGRTIPDQEQQQLLTWFGCPAPNRLIAGVDAGTRRLLDVAGAVAARPRVVLLDEPAAGLSHEESMRLAACIAQIPERFGISVLLVEHDMDLVRLVCNEVVVLDFGRIIAQGATAETLKSKQVIAAYVGAPEELLAS